MIDPFASTDTRMTSGDVSDCPCAVGSLTWREGRVKEEVSIKKISRRNTTSIRGAISIEVVRRLGRVNMGLLDGRKLFFLGALAGLGGDSGGGGRTQKII